MTQEPVLQFPCEYPLKVMGFNTELFETEVTAIIERHAAPATVEYTRQLSSGGKYLSLTATFTATSREQLDALYRELTSHALVKVAL